MSLDQGGDLFLCFDLEASELVASSVWFLFLVQAFL